MNRHTHSHTERTVVVTKPAEAIEGPSSSMDDEINVGCVMMIVFAALTLAGGYFLAEYVHGQLGYQARNCVYWLTAVSFVPAAWHLANAFVYAMFKTRWGVPLLVTSIIAGGFAVCLLT